MGRQGYVCSRVVKFIHIVFLKKNVGKSTPNKENQKNP